MSRVLSEKKIIKIRKNLQKQPINGESLPLLQKITLDSNRKIFKDKKAARIEILVNAKKEGKIKNE